MKNLICILVLFFQTLLIAEESSVGFLFFGDQGKGNKAQFEVAKGMEKFCSNHDCQFALLLGDNFYGSGVSSVKDPQWKSKFEEPYKNLLFQFFAVLGNHDHYGNYKAEIEYSQVQKKWVMPGRYYHFSKGDIDFYGLDTEEYDSKQAEWVEASVRQSTSAWKILFGHHPIYSYGMHGDTPKLFKSLIPLLQNQADLYLCGHDHDLQVIEKNKIKTVVSGTASEVRPSKSSTGTLYSSSTLGFSYLLIQGSKAELSLLDKNGELLFQKEWTK